MTSDQLSGRNKALENLSYRITGTGGVCLPVSCELCVSVEAAEQHALKTAKDYAKTFYDVKLYKKVGGEEKVIYSSKAVKKFNFMERANKLFKPVQRDLRQINSIKN